MRIAIVDDEEKERVTTEACLRDHIRACYPEEESALRIDAFANAETLIEAFEPGMYDLLILDIFMEDVNGMQAAQIIRAKDRDVSIVFLTGSDEYLLDGYRVFAVGYFLKPLAGHEKEFAETFAHIFPKLKERHRELSVRTGSKDFSVPYRNILYVDIDWQHKLCLHMANSDISVPLSYEGTAALLLEDSRFLECHHRILVNMDMIASMGKEDFVLKNGAKVPISHRKAKEAKQAYMHYMAHK